MTNNSEAQVRVIPGNERHHWRNEWLDSRQSFPVTGNFDLQANAHGLLMVHNDDIVFAGEGFDAHQHRDTEIVTWVLEGTLLHRDSAGNSGVIHPGLVQRMSAGSGISHSETNGAPRSQRTPLRVVQMWIPPDRDGVAPSYREADFSTELERGELTVVASGIAKHRDSGAVGLGNRYAALHVARLRPGMSVSIPDAPFGHVYLARGSVTFEGHGRLDEGDAVRLTSSGGQTVTALSDAEILVWEMHAEFAL